MQLELFKISLWYIYVFKMFCYLFSVFVCTHGVTDKDEPSAYLDY